MANVKRVFIEGELPFDAGDDEEVIRLLGQLNLPSFGLRIRYGKQSFICNNHGGQTTMYEFTIEGVEAIRFETFDYWVKILKRVGTVGIHTCVDIENM